MDKAANGLNFGKDCDILDSGDGNSDELRSLQGSDDEVDSRPTFNPETDFNFKKKVKLQAGLKFPDADVMRKAFVHHSIDNRYDFYYLHSARDRVSVYCRNRCSCEFNTVRCKFVGCKCPKKNWCPFKIYATKKDREEFWEISTMNLRHTCEFTGYTSKVSSEYLAERYLEDWRENPSWKLSAFQRRVYRDLGIEVKYGVCWLARARAKLTIYGDGAEQYARVWQYVDAIRQYNHGSTAIVLVDNIERPPPIFQRMYLCFKAVKDGFLAGCRPLVGVDGCHLKGAYPGMCLVAVGKDGNNNIYPIAWAVVEVENGETWSWFLKLLVEDLGKEDGDGLTFMSDRQKGLLDAFKVVTPKAELRFCVRHIWANFKLQFTGQVYKEAFWSAARCTTKAQFKRNMEGMKFLSQAAYDYLTAIPLQHWSRHAFSPNCKSNMLLNNMCESFNATLKDARDKPILTHMEWIRRYVMKRHCQKREGLKTWEGTQMPYVKKYLEWAVEEARLGTVFESQADEYEVEHRSDQHAVNLKERTCSCYHWELTDCNTPYL
ncbi:uncharacterized protein LOC141658929 [Silene latifolia]|uniref:uncharacterized protein LOC141658929 n=1 Tax=Silene latifolia TaxID=37657 RepID=UPI003D76E179